MGPNVRSEVTLSLPNSDWAAITCCSGSQKMQVSGDFAGQIVRRDEQFSGHILFDEGTESLKLLHSVPDFVDLAVLLRF